MALRPIRLLLLAGAALLPALASALDETYQGVLEPGNRAPKIPIVVKLKDLGMSLQGSVTTSGSYKSTASIGAGENSFGLCTINVQLSNAVSLRMNGPCDPVSYAGTYEMFDKQKRTRTYGTFNLPRRPPEAVKPEVKRSTATLSSCLMANTQCLVACPRNDEGAEFVCSNRCRTKLQTCKAQTKKTAPVLPEAD